MAEFSIDQSSLPAVNAVCRQFAVREDHSLAHNLQEQEIEHHLASNIQRNRLVQNDLQVAKKLQEEENKKAQIRLQRHHREMELRDNQMAQVIQDELALESEKKRRQEEKDEAIARKLQEKEEKLRRKHQQVMDHEPLDDAFEGNGDHVNSRVHKPDRKSRFASGCQRNRDSDDSQPRGAVGGSYSKVRVDNWIGQPAARGSTDGLCCSDPESDDSSPGTGRQKNESCPRRKEPPVRPPPPILNSASKADSNYLNKGARPKTVGAWDESRSWTDCGAHSQKNRDKAKCDCSPKPLGSCYYSPDELTGRREKGRDDGKRRKKWWPSVLSDSADLLISEDECLEPGGLKPKMEYGVKEATRGISRMSARDLEWKDAELARKLQEEEIRATQSSERAAQLAQDEEIARLLMEEEKKQVLRKSKEKDSVRRAGEDWAKGSSDWRRLELEKKLDTSEYIRPRPQEELEPFTGKPERPARLPAHRVNNEDLYHRPSSQRTSRPVARSSEPSQKALMLAYPEGATVQVATQRDLIQTLQAVRRGNRLTVPD